MNKRDLNRLGKVLKHFGTTIDKSALILWLSREFTEFDYDGWSKFSTDTYQGEGERVADLIGTLRADLDAAQERERQLRECLAMLVQHFTRPRTAAGITVLPWPYLRARGKWLDTAGALLAPAGKEEGHED